MKSKTPITIKLAEMEKMYQQDRYIPTEEWNELRRMIDKYCEEKAKELN